MPRCGQQAAHNAWTTLRVAHMPTGPTATPRTLHKSTRVHENGTVHLPTHSHTRWTEKRGPARFCPPDLRRTRVGGVQIDWRVRHHLDGPRSWRVAHSGARGARGVAKGECR